MRKRRVTIALVAAATVAVGSGTVACSASGDTPDSPAAPAAAPAQAEFDPVAFEDEGPDALLAAAEPAPSPGPSPTPPDEPSSKPADAPKRADFELKRVDTGMRKVADGLRKELANSGASDVLKDANRTAAAGGECDSPAFKDMKAPAQRYCFDDSDTGKAGSSEVEWMPQGVSTSADAQPDQQVAGSKAIAVSWYDKGKAPKKGVRVSFLDTGTKKYRHVLLVEPWTNTKGNPSYKPVNIHAGGVLWYGKYLYVVDTSNGIRVFDTSYLMDLDASGAKGDTKDTKEIGRKDGKYYAAGYRYILPQVESWITGGKPKGSGYDCATSGPPKFSFISVDRSQKPARLITGEYCSNQADPNRNGRVAQWPMDGAEPKTSDDGTWRADNVYRMSNSNVQGAVSYDGKWYLSRSGGGTTGSGHLTVAKAKGSGEGVLEKQDDRKAAIGPEDLSYWPGRDEIWTVTEHPGKRVLYGVPR